jgi:catechol 2,3-dioxygenase-like lactoylglutathione lyase family enzyme
MSVIPNRLAGLPRAWRRLRLLGAAALTIVATALAPASAQAVGTEPLLADGWSEVVVSVSDLEAYRRLFVGIGGWHAEPAAPVPSDVLALWGLPPAASAREVRVALQGAPGSFVRLVQFKGVPQLQIRSSANHWDSGGLFDITVMVPDISRKFRELQRVGIDGYSEPLEGGMGPIRFSKVRMRGPDGVVLGLIERKSPPLEGWPAFQGFSQPFSVSLVARDPAVARRFYVETLGCEVYLEAHGRGETGRPTLAGLPANLSGSFTGHSIIVRPPPKAANHGRVEILAYEGLDGRDFSDRAAPPNLGLMLARFPVANIEHALLRLRAAGVDTLPPRDVEIAPYGRVRMMPVRAPHGAWLELYERL